MDRQRIASPRRMLAGLLLAGALPAAAAAAAETATCNALAGRHPDAVRVVAATAIVPQGAWLPPAALGQPAPVSVPFCRVEGVIEGRIGFEVWLPPRAAWNGRLLGAGVGGDAGVFNFRDLARGVAAGYASATTDGGHKASETLWMMRPDAVQDYTHRAQHALNRAARALVARYYGDGPHHAYFLGCSGGGRQGLKQMQRYPGDYDGIVAGAGAPAMPEMSARHLWQALYQQRNPAGVLDAADWSRVAAAAVRACDADDGLADGVVEHPPSCRFDVGTLQCAAGATGECLTAEQVRTVRLFQQPLHDENGRRLDPGLLPGVTTRPGPPSPLLLPLFAQGVHRNPQWSAESFHIARDLALVDRRMPEMRADHADLGAFAARGGKAILYQGWLDPSVIASQSLDYFNAVQQRLGRERTDAVARLYMVPGMLHCRGGDGVDQFGNSASTLPIGGADPDMLTALTQWVERGVAPRAIIGTRLQDGKPVRERPLCPHPQRARYTGGDPANAASFRCEDPPPRIDGRHAQGARWAIDLPAQWNGTLLLYARGYGAGPADTPPETAPRGTRELLLSQGYALAASAYTGREWAVEEAPRDQIEVLDAFEKQVGHPRRTIAWGNSMGGLVSVALAEQHPDRLAGALPMCGSVSGSLGMLNTALDGAFAFRTLVAPDPAIRVVEVDDDRANSTRVQAALATAWQTPQGRARVLLAAALAQLPTWSDANAPQPAARDYDAQAEQVRRTFAMGVFVPRVDQQRRAGGTYSWNTGIDYRAQLRRSGRLELVRHFYAQAGLDLEADLATLNAAPRIAAAPGAVAYMRANYVPTGRLRIPLLAMQTVGDGLTVPATHGSLRQFVKDAGAARAHAELWVNGGGHCTFSPAEIIAALRTLEARLDAGRWSVAPAAASARGAGLPGGTRFVQHAEPPLLRHCGAAPGSCPGEPAPRAVTK